MRMLRGSLVPAGIILVLAALAPDRAAIAQAPRTYGTKAESFYRLNPPDFVPYSDGTSYFNGGGSVATPVASGAFFSASVHLPSGAVLTSVELDGCDTAPDAKFLTAQIMQCDRLGASCAEIANLKPADNGGCQAVSHDLTLDPTAYVNDATHQLLALVTMDSNFTSLRGIVVGYKLQVSPAPVTATFADVPTDYIYFRAIEELAASGVTQGCGGGNFCPNQPVTRGELAKFLANALGLHWQ